MNFRLTAAFAAPLLMAGLPQVAAAGTLTTLYDFGGTGDASDPSGGVSIGTGGVVYGATLSGGVGGSGAVYAVTPPAMGQTAWTEAVLHSFSADQAHFDGVRPQGSVLAAQDGSLFGTTSDGGNAHDTGAGTVYHLVPPVTAGASWTLHTLHVFPAMSNGEGAQPTTGVVMDGAGNLYGTTPEQGSTNINTVVVGGAYELTPPPSGQTSWGFTKIYSFAKAQGRTTSPVSAPVLDAAGNLYFTVLVGSTSTLNQCEIVKLSPPAGGAGTWTLTVLYKLQGSYGGPVGDLAIDASGALYGTTVADGTGTVSAAYRLSPPASGQTAWTATILYVFSSAVAPVSGLAMASGGQVYGNATGGAGANGAGVTYQLTPPTGTGRWTYSLLHEFTGKPATGGTDPIGTPAIGSGGAVFGATQGGGTGEGTVFQIVP